MVSLVTIQNQLRNLPVKIKALLKHIDAFLLGSAFIAVGSYHFINQEFFEEYLYSGQLPNVDLVIRTSGEMRLSNFFLWKSHYAEFYCTEVKWPDFDQIEMKKALLDYNERHRRYGKTIY